MGLNTYPSNPWPMSTDKSGNGDYDLPIASADTIGGVKVGNGLEINAETGVLSNTNPTPYSLPTAGAETLGGVKVGTGLAIDAETGVLSNTNPTPYTPFAFSTNEVNTGQKWVDGSDIFCKVYNNIQLANNTDVTVDANFGTDKNVIWVAGSGKYTNDNDVQYVSLGNYLSGTDLAMAKVENGTLKAVVKDNWSAWTCHFIIYYTKITT